MAVENEILVRVVDVSKEYAFGKQQLMALKNVSMSVLKGEFLAIAGPSGSGKINTAEHDWLYRHPDDG